MSTENESKPAVSGSVKVHESVLAAIVRKAVASIPDVIRLSGSSFVDNIAEIVSARKAFDRSMLIEVDGDTVMIEVRIVVKYGVSIPAVAAMVRGIVTADVVRMTGMKVGKVNVVVMDVDEETSAGEEEDAAE
ncbi:MAG: Asp23/Gls24 family envelope stress response protein [Lentisphaeria bacterium]|nr:Asp23/Gls24 family envelope stress response protein [Lentisphaeria bacterium]